MQYCFNNVIPLPRPPNLIEAQKGKQVHIFPEEHCYSQTFSKIEKNRQINKWYLLDTWPSGPYFFPGVRNTYPHPTGICTHMHKHAFTGGGGHINSVLYT